MSGFVEVVLSRRALLYVGGVAVALFAIAGLVAAIYGNPGEQRRRRRDRRDRMVRVDDRGPRAGGALRGRGRAACARDREDGGTMRARRARRVAIAGAGLAVAATAVLATGATGVHSEATDTRTYTVNLARAVGNDIDSPPRARPSGTRSSPTRPSSGPAAPGWEASTSPESGPRGAGGS